MFRPITRAISRAVTTSVTGWPGASAFDPISLFSNGEHGFLWSSLPYHQDPAGTTVATWGNPVGLIEDATDNEVEFTQATVTARPILGRVPVGGRRNSLVNTELRTASWLFPTNTSREAAAAVTPDGMQADRITLIGTTSHQLESFLGNPLAAGSHTISLLVYFENLPSSYDFQLAYYDGSTSVVGAQVVVTPDMVGAWVRLSAVIIVPGTVVAAPRIRLNGYGVGSEGTTYLFGEPQVEPGTEVTPYQAVTSNYDITESGVHDAYYLRFDGTDDSVSTTLPAITNGTVVIAGTKGIWIDDQYNHAGGTFAIGTDTYTGGPVGLLPILGDLIVGGCFVIDRQLTAEERIRVINKLKSMGAPGVFELGPELNANSGPGFQTTDGWTEVASAEIYVTGGELRVKNTTLQFGRARRNITGIEPGQSYLASFSTRGVVAWPTTFLGYSNVQDGYFQVVNTSTITMSVAITAVQGETNILFNLQNTNSSEENEGAVIYYSLRKLELIP